MTFAGKDATFYTLAFLVPGFIIHWILATCIPRRPPTAELALPRYLTLSSINYAVCSWIIYLLLYTSAFKHHPDAKLVSWLFIILISPLILGLLGSYGSQRQWDAKILSRFNIKALHPIPDAWDYVFSNTESVYIRVTLTDGSSVYGWYGNGSFASTEFGERDIYISSLWETNSSGMSQKIPDNKGILIKGEQIKYIEFWDAPEEVNVKQEHEPKN